MSSGRAQPIGSHPEDTSGAQRGGTRGSRMLFRAVCIAWALLALAVAAGLASAGGHPPGLVFVPLVALAWLAGHLLVLATARAARRMARLRPQTPAAHARPAAFWIAAGLLALGFVGATAALLFLTASLLVQRSLGLLEGLVAAAALGLWALHAVVLAGLAAERRWGLAALRLALAGWGLWFGWMVVAGAFDRRAGIALIGLAGVASSAGLAHALRPRDQAQPPAG